MWILRVLLAALMVALVVFAGGASAQPKPEFKLGFKALAEQIPAIVGEPLENEHIAPSGDSLQRTTTGLMVWRKASNWSNWTAFTNGSRTWVNGPRGLQERGNGERFEWEIPEFRPPSTPRVRAHLGPGGPLPIRSIAVSPDWPQQRVLVAFRQMTVHAGPERVADLVRSVDGGASWDWMESPSEALSSVVLARAPGNHLALFGLAPDGLYRSTDLGTSWQTVHQWQNVPDERLAWSVVATMPPGLSLSPDFESDGLALLAVNGHLYRGTEAGIRWEEVAPAPGQRVARAVFSPDFARDRTIFLAAVTSGFPHAEFYSPGREPWTHHERSLGVLVSTDAGETWRQSSQGLSVEGVPYRHVQSLAISPTFGEDGTLFAFAWGPLESRPGDFYRHLRSGLFKSRDRGASWEQVSVSAETLTYPVVAVSTSYFTDAVVLLAANSPGMSPTSHRCAVYRTDDGGDNWTKVMPASTETGCGPLFFLSGREDRAIAVLQRAERGRIEWLESEDAGFTWSGRLATGNLLVPSPAFGADQTFFTADRGESSISEASVWAIGSSLEGTDGQLRCPAAPGPAFSRAWNSSASGRPLVGCPLEPERQVRVREQSALDDFQLPIFRYWTNDDVPLWFELRARENGRGGKELALRAKARAPWPEGQDREVEGVLQRFEAGYMLWLTRVSGEGVILSLPYETWRGWSDVPDR